MASSFAREVVRGWSPRIWAVTGLMMLAIAIPGSAQQIHALLVSDVSPSARWGVYEPNLTFDVLNMSGFLEMNTPERALQVSYLTIMDDEAATPANVLSAVRELQPGPNDTVVFYYTGHGGVDDRGSYLELAGGKLYREEVRGILDAMRPRLTVLLTDCCNSRSDGRKQLALAPMFPRPEAFTPLFRSLFIEPSGLVDINSSAPGESAFFLPVSDEGGEYWGSIFTKELTEWAGIRRDRRVTWSDLLREVGVQVSLSFREAFPKGVSAAKGAAVQTEQTVFAWQYPNMPEARGYRLGVQVRDHDGRGVMITEIVSGSPAATAFDIKLERYGPLPVGALVVKLNGKDVRGAEEFARLLKESPPIMRLTIDDGTTSGRSYLVRLRY